MVALAVVWCRFSGLPSRSLESKSANRDWYSVIWGSKIEQSLYSVGVFFFARVRICEPLPVLKQQTVLSEIYEMLCLDTVT